LGLVELHAPTFIVEEVGKPILRATKLKRLLQEDAQEALNALNDMKIILHELDWAQTAQSLEIACKHNIALCDASYLFLTNKVKAQLIIADNKLFQTAKVHFRVLNMIEYT
jgi:predicted nucleic acid-binding protein